MKSSSKIVLASAAVIVVIAVVLAVVYFRPSDGSANAATGGQDYFSWIGVVTDGNYSPAMGVTVTLHLMTPSGEARNLTNQTIASSPYPGSYAFYDVPVPDGVTYAYAVADTGEQGDGTRYVGQTGNFEINRSIISSGIIVLHNLTSGGNATPGNGSGQRVLDGWFGTVIDNDSRPLSNVSVTLHLMSPDGEVASYTRQSLSEGPYPGSFVFDNITLPDNATFGYVSADSVNGTVRSNDYDLNKPRISSGSLVL